MSEKRMSMPVEGSVFVLRRRDHPEVQQCTVRCEGGDHRPDYRRYTGDDHLCYSTESRGGESQNSLFTSRREVGESEDLSCTLPASRDQQGGGDYRKFPLSYGLLQEDSHQLQGSESTITPVDEKDFEAVGEGSPSKTIRNLVVFEHDPLSTVQILLSMKGVCQ